MDTVPGREDETVFGAVHRAARALVILSVSRVAEKDLAFGVGEVNCRGGVALPNWGGTGSTTFRATPVLSGDRSLSATGATVTETGIADARRLCVQYAVIICAASADDTARSRP